MPQEKKTIFISYGRDKKNPQDIALIRKVKQDLEKAGFIVLMDEKQLRTTHDWAVELEGMLLKSHWVLFFITPYSARRPDGFCLREMTASLGYGIPIAPVMLRQEALPIEICRLQYLDLQALSGEEDYHQKIIEIIDVLNGEKELGFEGEHIRTLRELNPLKFETTITDHLHRFVGREWVYSEVENWLNNEDSRVLWLQAEAGFGKSAIAAYLASKHPSALSVYFCQHDYAESKDPKEMLKVFIYELSTQLIEYHKILQSLNIKEILQKSAEHIFTQMLLEPLQQISEPNKKYFFVIDALDEAMSGDQNEIVALISNRFLTLPSWLRIVVTSSYEPKLMQKLKKFKSIELKTQDANNIEDLVLYLQENENIEDQEIIEVLIKKSEGNILYLKSLFNLDFSRQSVLDIESINLLPVNIEALYLTYFERKFPDISEYKKNYLDLVSLLVSQEGLNEQLLQDILSLDERAYKRMKYAFGSLLKVYGDTLGFYNRSISKWLKDYDMSGEYSADIEKGHRKFLDLIDNLEQDGYKKIYADLFLFNKKIIDRYLEREYKIDRYFRLLEPINVKKKIALFDHLAWEFFSEDKIYVSCIFLEENRSLIEPLHTEDPESWREDYIETLHDLAYFYQAEEQFENAIRVEEENLLILRSLYHKDPDKWQVNYSSSLKNLSDFYQEKEQYSKAIEFSIERSKVLQLAYIKDARWEVIYINSQINLANLYKQNSETSKAHILKKEAIGQLYKLTQEDMENWLDKYIDTILGLSNDYTEDDQLEQAIDFHHKYLSEMRQYHNENSHRWDEYFINFLLNSAYLHRREGSYAEALKYEEESFEIRDLYLPDDFEDIESYIATLMNLAYGYYRENDHKQAIEYVNQCRSILNSITEKYNIVFDDHHLGSNGLYLDIDKSFLLFAYYRFQKSDLQEDQEACVEILEENYDLSPRYYEDEMSWMEKHYNQWGRLYSSSKCLEKKFKFIKEENDRSSK